MARDEAQAAQLRARVWSEREAKLVDMRVRLTAEGRDAFDLVGATLDDLKLARVDAEAEALKRLARCGLRPIASAPAVGDAVVVSRDGDVFGCPATVTAVVRGSDDSGGVATFEVRVLGEDETAAPLALQLGELAQFEMDGEITTLGGSSAALEAIWNVVPGDDADSAGYAPAAPPAPSPAQISKRVAGLLKDETERKAADKSRAPTSRAERKAASKASRKKKSRRSPPTINGV